MEKFVRRTIHTRSVDTLAVKSTDLRISGYAVKWGRASVILKSGNKRFKEIMERGAFSESLRNDDQYFLWSHDTSQVLGRKKSGTLRLYEDSIGLKFHLSLPDTTIGRHAYELVKRRDITGISVGFRVQEDEWDDYANHNYSYRKIRKAKLKEISAVAFPAYEDSDVKIDVPMEGSRELTEEEQRARLRIMLML